MTALSKIVSKYLWISGFRGVISIMPLMGGFERLACDVLRMRPAVKTTRARVMVTKFRVSE